MSATAFCAGAGAAASALRRSRAPSRARWLCEASPRGRGVWDLPSQPQPQSHARAARSHASRDARFAPPRDARPDAPRRRGPARAVDENRGGHARRARDDDDGFDIVDLDAEGDRGRGRDWDRGRRDRDRDWDRGRRDRDRDWDDRGRRDRDRDWDDRGRRDRDRDGDRGRRDRDREWDRGRRDRDRRPRYDWRGAGARDTQDASPPLDPERVAVRAALDNESDDLLYGIAPVHLALQTRRRAHFTRLFLQNSPPSAVVATPTAGPSRKPANATALEKILAHCAQHEVPVSRVAKGDLNSLTQSRPHQGVVLQTAPLDFVPLPALPTVSRSHCNELGVAPCYLVLDEVSDPHNAGALLRSAHFLGADGVIVCRRNSCALTAAVSKASAGALELMPVFGVSSMPRFLNGAAANGWRVVGMACGDDAVSSKEVSLDCPTLVVLGSEGNGLRPLVRQACDIIVQIRGVEEAIAVDSLNVSVAGAVALYQLLGR